MDAEALWNPRFDDRAFAEALRPAVTRFGVREVARLADVSPSTVSRAAQGWPQLSHENFLRLSTWLERANVAA